MQLPKEPSRGEPVTAEWGRQVVRCLRALMITSVVNGSFDRTANGTSIRCNPKGGAAGELLLPPFTLYQDADPEAEPEAPANTFRVTPGTVGNQLPSNYDELFEASGELVFVWLAIEADYESGAMAITSVEIDSGEEVPEDIGGDTGEPPSTFHVQIGLVHLDDDGNITQVDSTLQRSIFPQVVVSSIDCGSVTRSVLI